MSERDIYREMKGVAREPFQSRTPDSFSRARGDVRTVEQLAAINRRSDRLTNRLRDHCQKFEETWVAKEAIQIWNKRTAVSQKHPSPDGSPPAALDPKSIMQQARRQVRARTVTRLSNLNQTKTRMENAVLRTAQEVRRDQAPQLSLAFDNTKKMRRTMS